MLRGRQPFFVAITNRRDRTARSAKSECDVVVTGSFIDVLVGADRQQCFNLTRIDESDIRPINGRCHDDEIATEL